MLHWILELGWIEDAWIWNQAARVGNESHSLW